MDSSSTISPGRRGSTGSLPGLGRRVSGGSAKTVRWIGKQLKNFKKEDDSDSEELWGTSIERPFDLEDPNCPVDRVPSGYVPLHILANRARLEELEKHGHKTSLFAQEPKKVTSKMANLDLIDLYQPLPEDGQGSNERRARRPVRKSKTPLYDLPPRPMSRVDQLKSIAREDAASPAPKSPSPLPSAFASRKKQSSRDDTPRGSATWSGPRIRARRRPDISRWNEVYEAPK